MAGRRGIRPSDDGEVDGEGADDIEVGALVVAVEKLVMPGEDALVVVAPEDEVTTGEGDAIDVDDAETGRLGMVPRGPAPVCNGSSRSPLGEVTI